MKLTPQERIDNFAKVFPKYPPFFLHNNRLYSIWIIGSLFRKRIGFYGEFPYKLKDRILTLFPDCKKILHLFSGTIQDDKQLRLDPQVKIITYDISPKFNPIICDDVRNIKDHEKKLKDIELIIADPPYETKDFERYKQKSFNKAQVIRDLGKIMKSQTYMVWLDVIIPIYNKKVWKLLGHVGVIVGTNTRMRVLTLWEHT